MRARLIFALVFVGSAAHATPRTFPFTYNYETLPEGSAELEIYGDISPVKALSASTGAPAWYGATQFQAELEYGLLDRLELGLYVTFVPRPGDSLTQVATLTEGNGLKQRLRLRLAEAGEWPVDIGLYGEVAENDSEVELEAKVIVQRRIGKVRAVANLWGEREFYYTPEKDWVLNPTLGAAYEISPKVQPGIEGWMRVEFPDSAPSPRPFNVGPHVYAGPTLLLNFGRIWWSNGIYLRCSNFGRSPAPGDSFGAVWARSIVGFDL
jgi:hypothetical protein